MNSKTICAAATFGLSSLSPLMAAEILDNAQDNSSIPEFDVARIDALQSGDLDFDNGPGSLSLTTASLRLLLAKPIVLGDSLTLLPFFSYKFSSLDFDNTPAGFPIEDEDLHSLSVMTVGFKEFRNSNWLIGGFARAELASDFQAIDTDAITFDVAAGVGYRFSDRLTAGVGLVATDLNNEANLFPGLNFDWKPTDKFHVGLYGTTFFTTYKVNPCWNLSILAQNGGGTWNFNDANSQTRTVDLDSFNVGLYTQNKLANNVWLRFGIGYSFGNEIEIRDVSGANSLTQDLGGAPFAQVSVSLTQW